MWDSSPHQDVSGMGQINPGLLPEFEAAFLEKCHLRFAFRDAKGPLSTHVVEPLAMLILPPLWYSVWWDPTRDDLHCFRLGRISATTLVEDASFRRRHLPQEDDFSPFVQTSCG